MLASLFAAAQTLPAVDNVMAKYLKTKQCILWTCGSRGLEYVLVRRSVSIRQISNSGRVAEDDDNAADIY